MSAALRRDLARLLGGGANAGERVICPVPASSPYNADATGAWRGLRGRADAVVLPESDEQVAAVVGYCHAHGLGVIPRGGGSGVSGGACPIEGGVVVSLERMDRVLELAPELWRMHVQAGLITAHVHRLARESGLFFGPDPGAAEQSQIGGNVATDAGGPHAFKYGSTRHWVMGMGMVLPHAGIVRLGGASRKDVAGYDLTGLMVGSEGTLGVITDVWLRLIPAPEAAAALVAFLPDERRGCEAVQAAMTSGVIPSALDFLDASTLTLIAASYPGEVPAGAGFALIAEVDGGREEVERSRRELTAALVDGAAIQVDVHDPRAAWRWRSGASVAVAAVRGGKVSEDVCVPLERLGELLARFAQIAAEAGLPSCAWGHGGDANAHATVMVDPSDPAQMAAAERVAERLFELACELGGSLSGEHGIGLVKRNALPLQLRGPALAMHRAIKDCLDPDGVMNPGVGQPQTH